MKPATATRSEGAPNLLTLASAVATATLVATSAIGSPQPFGLDQIAPSLSELGVGWSSNRVGFERVSAPVERLKPLAELVDQNLLRMQEIHPVLRQVEERFKPILVQLTPTPTVEYQEHSDSMVVRYLTREFQVHARSRSGDWSTNTVTTVGPDSNGFVLQAFLQRAGEVNSFPTPQTIQEPYWKTLVDVTLAAGTTNQVLWGLSFGNRTDEGLLNELKTTLRSLQSPKHK